MQKFICFVYEVKVSYKNKIIRKADTIHFFTIPSYLLLSKNPSE